MAKKKASRGGKQRAEKPAAGSLRELVAPGETGDEERDEEESARADDDQPVSKADSAPRAKTSGKRREPWGETEFPWDGRSARGETPSSEECRLLDAWFGEFGDPLAAAAVADRAEDGGLRMRQVIGRDDRVRIEQTDQRPWRWLCELVIHAADETRWTGTGWLAGERLVMTAGHNVFLHKHGGWADRIEVLPGRDAAREPFGRFVSQSLHSVRGWTVRRLSASDYGAVILPEAVGGEEGIGNFGFAELSDEDFAAVTVNLSGYPAPPPEGTPAHTQWWHARRVARIGSRRVHYRIDTAKGQSGSPVFYKTGDDRYAVGIHNYGSPGHNTSTRITGAVYENILHWRDL